MNKRKIEVALYKKATKNQISVGKMCEVSNSNIWLVDNGDGHIITQNQPKDLLHSEFAECLVEVITANTAGCIVLWIPRVEDE